MRTSTRVLGYLGLLALVLVAGLGLGRWVGPDADPTPAAGASHGHDEHAAGPAAGLQVSEHGHTLALRKTRLPPGRRELAFTIEGEDGPVTDYDVQHEKELHLVVVRRDLTGFQHVHPERDPDGTWRVPIALEPGAWRVLADVDPADGEAHVLGADLFVPGDFRPVPVGAQQLSASVDGYDVNLGGTFATGDEVALAATVSRDGDVVTDLQPYLGASGHLVALRAGDLGYLHVHPDQDGPTNGTAYRTTFPSAGSYRLFLDFKHEGRVRTVAFTVDVERADDDQEHGEGHEEEHGHDH